MGETIELKKEENELWNKIRSTPEVRDIDFEYLKRINEIKKELGENIVWDN